MSSESKVGFFRQSGWMVGSGIIAGVFMFGVHPAYAKPLGERAYGDFLTMLSLLMFITIPSLGLQTVFAQQTAVASSIEGQKSLTSTTQTLLRWTFILWLAMLTLAALFQEQIAEMYKITDPVAFGIIAIVGLLQLWTPILSGVLQGKQNFLWLGWSGISNSIGRFVAIGIIVLLFAGKATGAVFGTFIGILVAFLIVAWQSREVWWKPSNHYGFAHKEWLSAVVPLTLGLGASQFIFLADFIVARNLFGQNLTGVYGITGTIGRGIVLFTAPLSAVMFPKIVSNISQRTKSNVLLYTVLSTFVLAGCAAAGCTLLSFGIKYILNEGMANLSFLPQMIILKIQGTILNQKIESRIFSELLPWYAWGMVPLAMANVLLNNLMARRKYGIVLYAVAVGIAYAIVLRAFGTSFLRIVQILGLFNLLFFVVIGTFTWWETKREETMETAGN